MPQVLIISSVFPPEPVVSANLSFDIANALSEKEEVTVLSPKPTRPFGFKFNTSVPAHKFKHVITNSYTCARSSLFGRFKESSSFGKHAYKYIIENRKDIKVIYANAWPLMAQRYIVKAGKRNNIPVIIHVQDIYPESLTSKIPLVGPLLKFFLIPIDKYILRNAFKVIAISEKMKKYIVETRGIPNDKVEVVLNWQDENNFIQFHQLKPLPTNEPKLFTFMYMGNVGPVAGIDLLIEAFAEAKLSNSRLVIAGSGSMRDPLEKMAGKFKEVVIDFWDVPDGKVPEIQSKADVMLLPVKKGAALSSIPSKLPSYMFSKKPVIACVDKGSDTGDCIKAADCGYVLDPENKEQLSKCMTDIMGLPEKELNRMGESGFAYAYTNLSKRSNLAKIISILMKE